MFTSAEWIAHELTDESAVWEHAVCNANRLLDSRFSAACRKRPAHQVRPMCKSVVSECVTVFHDAIDQAATNRWRSTTDISFAWILVPWYALLTQRAQLWPI